MRRKATRGFGVSVLALVAGFGACDLNEGGYDKVIQRDKGTIGPVAMPDPPPVVAGAAGGGAEAQVVAANLPAGVTQAMVDEGQKAYATVCGACHGPGGTGTPVAPALNDNEWLWVPGGDFSAIEHIINVGVPQPKAHPGMMPPKGGGNFTDEQVRALAAYVYALSNQAGA